MPQVSLDCERQRIREALIVLVAERGYGGTDLEDVLERAEVDLPTFERHFADLGSCLAEVWDEFSQQFLDCTGGAYEAADSWREGMRASAYAFCRFIQDDQARARFLIDSTFSSEIVEAKRDFIMHRYADLIYLGRLEREGREEVRRETADGIVGAVWEGIASRITAGAFEEIHGGVPQIMYLLCLTYLGPGAAEEELRRGPEDIARYQRGEL
jgi:AcrR family transcriptional regulator